MLTPTIENIFELALALDVQTRHLKIWNRVVIVADSGSPLAGPAMDGPNEHGLVAWITSRAGLLVMCETEIAPVLEQLEAEPDGGRVLSHVAGVLRVFVPDAGALPTFNASGSRSLS